MKKKMLLIICSLFIITGIALMAFTPSRLLIFYIAEDVWLKLRTQTSRVGASSDDLTIKKTETPYRDWNTGSLRSNTKFELSGRSEYSLEKIKELINSKHPNLIQYPEIWDVVKIASDNYIIIVSKDSQGEPYPVIHLQLKNGVLQADLLEVGGLGSQYNWFPSAHQAGWTRVIGKNYHQFLIQHEPFQIFDLGEGDYLKQDERFAYLADSKSTAARVVSLETGKTVAQLELSPQCFRFPRFDLDHPKLERETEDNRNISFFYSQKWWDLNFDWQLEKSQLTLGKNHVLPAPPSKILKVYKTMSEEGFKNRESGQFSAGVTTPPAYGDDSSVDQIPLASADCAKLNPRGVIAVKDEYAEELSTSTFELCFTQVGGLSDKEVSDRCKKINGQKIFHKGSSSVEKISYEYHPKNGKPSFQDVGFRLNLSNNFFESVKTTNGDTGLIREAYVMNPNLVLLQANATPGPWELSLLKVQDNGKYELSDLQTLAYPSKKGEWVDNKYLYFRSGSFLVRRDGSFLSLNGLSALYGNLGFSVYMDNDSKNVSVYGSNLDKISENPYDPSLIIFTRASFPLTCFSSMKLPDISLPFEKWQRWFEENFAWDSGGKKILLKNPCLKKK